MGYEWIKIGGAKPHLTLMEYAALGANSDLYSVNKFGQNPDIDTSEEVVWDYGGEYNWQAAAVTHYVSSDNALDTTEITVEGLDANYETVEESIDLQGTTFVPLTTSFIRVFRAYNSSATEWVGNAYVSSSNVGAGGIPTDTTKIHVFIRPAYQQTMMCVYTVPADHIGWIVSIRCSRDRSIAAVLTYQIVKRDFGKIWRTQWLHTTADGDFIQLSFPIRLAAKTDIELRCVASTTNVPVAAGFEIALLKDN
jgi:hypothetical protein